MNNLYHKVAVASVCTALSFVLGANKEAEAATFNTSYNFTSYLTFRAIDGGSYGAFDGVGDMVTNVSYNNDMESLYPHSWVATEKTDAREIRALTEFPFSSLTNAKITNITNAVLRLHVEYWNPFNDSASMGVFGYVGNGIAEASDFEAGVFVDSREITETGSWYDFNVTPFVKQIFSNNNEFAGFALRSLSQHEIAVPGSVGLNVYRPKLIVSGEFEGGVEPEPVPEPTTIFGSAIGLCLGGWLKRKKSTFQNNTTSQG